MSLERRPCPACARPNAAHAARCLYCGQALPDPAPAPATRERVVPANVDQLVRDALSGKRAGASQLKAALASLGPPPEVSRPAERAAPSPPGNAAATPAVVARSPEPPAEPVASPVDTLAALVASAAEARDAFAAGDMDGSAAALDRLDARSRQAREHLRRANTGNVSADLEVEDPPEDAGDGESSLPTEVPLPPVRLPWALVLGPPGVESADRVAEALSVDLATARSLAHSPHSRIALRSGDAAALEARAARAREAGFRAVVVARETLAERPALAALAFSAGAWRATPEPLWLLPPDPGRAVSGEMLDGARVILVCPGEVEVRAHREERARSRWLRGGFHAEAAAAARRVLVVDLHTAEGIVRVVEGVTVLDGLPGYDPSSAIKSIRGLVEAAAEAFPGARVEGRRACGIGPTAPSAHDLVRDTGWPQWEEHTRAARAAWV